MKLSKILSTSVALGALGFAASSLAVPTYVNVGGANNLQDELNAVTYSGSTANAGTSIDFLNVNSDQASPDEVFQIGGSGGAFSKLIFEFAGNASINTFGIYDINDEAKILEIFNGAAASGAFGLTIDTGSNTFMNAFTGDSIAFSTSSFGYYLSNGQSTFYSQASLNGGYDQMVAFEGGTGLYLDLDSDGNAGLFGGNEYVLAFEDIALVNSDNDYNDFVVLVESVTAVPEPSILALMGLGLVGMGVATRRKQKKA